MHAGMLDQLVMRKLAERPLSGYDLCAILELETGARPSYGSIYPLLERMAAAGLVTSRQEGRRKVYSLTPAGKRLLAARRRQCSALIDSELPRIKRLMSLMEIDPEPMLAIISRAKEGRPPLGAISHNMFLFRDTVFRMVQDGRAERHAKEINRMLLEMRRRLEALE